MRAPVSSGMAGYNVGYVFFTHAHDALAEGIDFYERWARGKGDLAVHHTGIVASETEVIEAHWQMGVRRAPLSKYWDDMETMIVFRRPAGWTAELGQRIAASALAMEGRPYDKGLILSQLCANTFIGHCLNKWFKGRPEEWVAKRLDNKQAFICSELSAYALDEQPEFAGLGILGREMLDCISPQELFEDDKLFEPLPSHTIQPLTRINSRFADDI